MTLKCSKKVIISVDYNDLEDYILASTGESYEILPMEEVGSSQYAAVYEVNVSSGELVKGEEEEWQQFRQGKKPMYALQTIMKHLSNVGLLEEGDYLIDVNW